MRRKFSKRFRAGKREYVWSTTHVPFFGTGIVPGLMDEITLVTRIDWARNELNTQILEKGATLVRIVGDVHYTINEVTVGDLKAIGDSHFIFGVLKRDEDDASVLDINVDAFGEDWMHMQSAYLTYANVSVATLSRAWGELCCSRHVDIRVKRKLTSDEKVSAFFTRSVGLSTPDPGNAYVGFTLRSLIQLP